MRSVAKQLKIERFSEAELRVFRTDHSLQDEELTALVAWWLR
jgi:hypothetical protein